MVVGIGEKVLVSCIREAMAMRGEEIGVMALLP
jgi:hypothetical protein